MYDLECDIACFSADFTQLFKGIFDNARDYYWRWFCDCYDFFGEWHDKKGANANCKYG